VYIKMARTNSHLIDSKGRLFGKINVIDALVFLFIILVVVAGLRFAFFGPEPQMTMVKLELKNQPDYIYDNLHVGDILLLNDNNNSMIVDIAVTSKKGSERDLLILADLDAEVDDVKIFFGNQELKVGKTIKLATPFVEFVPTIVSFGNDLGEITTDNKIVTVLFENVKPWIADSLIVGAKQEVQGDVVASLLSKDITPAKMVVQSEAGDVFLRDHPLNKDVRATVEISSQNMNNYNYFQGSEVFVGGSLTFYFDGLTVSGHVINLE